MGRFRQVLSTLLLVAMSVTMVTTDDDSTCVCDTARFEGLEDRISDLETLTSNLHTVAVNLKEENNKMKKLTLASMNLALTPQEDQCQLNRELVDVIGGLSFYVGLGPNSCELMGTALYPAISCGQIHEACHKKSGTFFIKNIVFAEVYCEMDRFDGGWTRFGKGGMESTWNYVDESRQEVNLTIISAREVKLIGDLHFNTFRVLTDVASAVQADASTNPSTLTLRSLPWLDVVTLRVESDGHLTRLQLTDEGDRFNCFGSCGERGLPRTSETSSRLMFTSVYFGPRAEDRGARAFNSEWSRNKYTWSGSYYYILAK